LIFWDIDGTLMHCGSDGKKALNQTFLEIYGITDAFTKAAIGGSMDSMLLEGIMDTFEINREDLPQIINHYQKVLIEILENDESKRILPGVISLLEAIELHPHTVNALLTSNLKIGAEAKLNSVKLDKYFNLGGFGDELGEKWDAAERCIVRVEARYKCKLLKHQIFLIGDSCYDILCAKKMGINSIAVATGWADKEALIACKPDFFFSDLSDTKRVLRAINI
jgi:phosphoglycolate phosphatase